MTADDVTDAMVRAYEVGLGTGFTDKSDIQCGLAAAINTIPFDLLRQLCAERGCVLVPREPTEAMVNAGLKAADDAAFCFIGSVIKYESTRPHLARLAYKAMLAAADPREQALDRMAENAQELGLYDEPGKEGDK